MHALPDGNRLTAPPNCQALMRVVPVGAGVIVTQGGRVVGRLDEAGNGSDNVAWLETVITEDVSKGATGVFVIEVEGDDERRSTTWDVTMTTSEGQTRSWDDEAIKASLAIDRARAMDMLFASQRLVLEMQEQNADLVEKLSSVAVTAIERLSDALSNVNQVAPEVEIARIEAEASREKYNMFSALFSAATADNNAVTGEKKRELGSATKEATSEAVAEAVAEALDLLTDEERERVVSHEAGERLTKATTIEEARAAGGVLWNLVSTGKLELSPNSVRGLAGILGHLK